MPSSDHDPSGKGCSLNRKEPAGLARLGVPLAGAYLADMDMALTDMAIVGRLGTLALAAVGLAGGIAFDLPGFLMGAITVVGILVAEAVGAGNRARIGALVGQGIRIALGLSLVAIAVTFALPSLLALTLQDTGIIPPARDYLHAVDGAFPLAIVYGVLGNRATVRDRTRSVFFVSVGAVILNSPLS